MNKNSDIKKMRRELLRLYAGAGVHSVLSAGIVWALVNQLNQEEHLTSAMLVMAGVYFADCIGQKLGQARKIRTQIEAVREKKKQR